MNQTAFYNPRKGSPAVALERFRWPAKAHEPTRTNYFSIYWIESGAGSVAVDAAVHAFKARALLFFSPYRRIRFTPSRDVRGALIQFHANFLCVETFHAESGCSGVLFEQSVRVAGGASEGCRTRGSARNRRSD